MTAPRAVVLSAGAWSQSTHIPALREAGAEVVAVTSLSLERAAAIADQFGIPSAFDDPRLALDAEPDIAVIAGPPVSHLDQALAAIERGIAVLVEKPMALTGEEAQRIAVAGESAGVPVLVGFTWSSAELFARARDLIRSGALGRVEHASWSIHANTRQLLLGSPVAAWDPDARSESSTYTDRSRSGGGVGAVTMCHLLSVAHWVLGSSVASVACETYDGAAGLDLHMSALASWASGASGVLVATSTQVHGAPTRWFAEIRGSAGDLSIDTLTGEFSFVPAEGAGGSSVDPDAGRPDVRSPTRALVASWSGERVPSAMSARLGVAVTRTTDALYASARSGGAPTRVATG